MSGDPAHSSENGQTDWVILDTCEVLADRRLPYPSTVREHIDNQEGKFGYSVFWHYEHNFDLIAVSAVPLRSDNFVFIDRTAIEKHSSSYARIRAPKSLPDSVLTHFDRGTRMVYLATRKMVAGRPSVWLLPHEDVLNILPGAGKSNTEGLRERLQTPPN